MVWEGICICNSMFFGEAVSALSPKRKISSFQHGLSWSCTGNGCCPLADAVREQGHRSPPSISAGKVMARHVKKTYLSENVKWQRYISTKCRTGCLNPPCIKCMISNTNWQHPPLLSKSLLMSNLAAFGALRCQGEIQVVAKLDSRAEL